MSSQLSIHGVVDLRYGPHLTHFYILTGAQSPWRVDNPEAAAAILCTSLTMNCASRCL